MQGRGQGLRPAWQGYRFFGKISFFFLVWNLVKPSN
jgi:hypothetical protein